MRKFKYTAILFCLISLFSSCITGDYDDCIVYKYPKIYFSYKDDMGNDLLNQYVSSATLYIYDASGNLVYTLPVSEQKMKANNGVQFSDLTEGNYKIVAWANMGKNTSISDVKTLDKSLLKTNSLATESTDPIYYGSETFKLVKGSNADIKIKLNSIHVKFSITVKGLDKLETPKLNLNNLQSTYNFLGKATDATGIEQKPTMAFKEDSKDFYSAFNFFKPKSTLANMILKLSHSQIPNGLTVNINEFIKNKYPNIDISNLNREIKLDMLIEFNGIEAIITIPKWEDKETGTDVQ